ncbi:MAG TPA: DUF1588 domain-containing protein [Polyangiaceae bacterium]|nr:DUF1588 domain-containing protein [Polyangiaceae bacterium]
MGIVAWLAAGLASCTAIVEGDAGSGPPPSLTAPGAAQPGAAGSSGTPTGTVQPLAAVEAPAVTAPFRQLTRQEYEHTVRDLLSVGDKVAERLPPESPTGLFTRNAFDRNMNEQAVIAYEDVARDLAKAAVSSDLQKLVSCDPADTANLSACGHAFIDTFGERAFRRPLTVATRDSLLGLFDASLRDYGFAEAISLTLQAIFQSPYFLYHVEASGSSELGPGATEVDEFGLAARLSYLLTGSLPDDSLWAAAKAGTLSAELGSHVNRLLTPERMGSVAWDFHQQWLRTVDLRSVYKDPARVVGFPEEGARNVAWEQSLHDFVTYVFGGDSPTLKTLFQSDALFLPPELSALYPPAPRFGLLTQPALLAKLAQPEQSNPVKRGLFVLQNALCQKIPPPPPAIADKAKAPMLATGMTTRQRYEQHSADPTCAGCHVAGGIDAFGFAFEHYDEVGRYRETENGQPIDSSGHYDKFADAARRQPFADAGELVERLVGSAELRDCMSALWYQYALGRAVRAEDAASLASLGQDFDAEGLDVRQLLVDVLTNSRAFRARGKEGSAP